MLYDSTCLRYEQNHESGPANFISLGMAMEWASLTVINGVFEASRMPP